MLLAVDRNRPSEWPDLGKYKVKCTTWKWGFLMLNTDFKTHALPLNEKHSFWNSKQNNTSTTKEVDGFLTEKSKDKAMN